MNCCSWWTLTEGLNMAWHGHWKWPLTCLDKKDSTPPRMWILLLAVCEFETWIDLGQEVSQWFCKNMFASRSISDAAITPRIKSPKFYLPICPSKFYAKLKAIKLVFLHSSFGRGMRFYVSLMGLKCSDTSLSWVRVPHKVLTISFVHHQQP